MEVGVFTFWTSKDNYGQALQSYALQKFLNNQENVHAEVIRYYASKLPFSCRVKSFVKRLLLSVFPIIDKKAYEINKKVTERNFEKFKKCNINYSSHILYGKLALDKFCEKYDVLIAGSDQVWSMMLDNPMNSVYYLDFGNSNQTRISYAASFGLHTYPIHLKNELKKQLSRFDFVSVREKDGVDICRDCGIDAVHVLDPTLLLDKSVYEKFLLRKNSVPYTFMYVLNINDGNDINWAELRKGIKTRRIVGTNGSGYTQSQIVLDGVEYENSTIEQWLSNIAYAESVVTTSFHGVVFSIVFEKNFVYIPLKGKYSQSNNRVVSLLSLLGLESQILNSETKMNDVFGNSIDYLKVKQKLKDLRKKSISFLMGGLQIK